LYVYATGAKHVLRRSSDDSAVQVFEGKIEGRPRRMWLDGLKEWTQHKAYTAIKRTAEDRSRLRLCTFKTCQPCDDIWWWWWWWSL